MEWFYILMVIETEYDSRRNAIRRRVFMRKHFGPHLKEKKSTFDYDAILDNDTSQSAELDDNYFDSILSCFSDCKKIYSTTKRCFYECLNEI